ncbi:MAG: redoxin domain-containing protein [Verrucomicrobiales bacterium]|nr:redoxin domain-containing protein [Verrucomicrobiales bacterium]
MPTGTRLTYRGRSITRCCLSNRAAGSLGLLLALVLSFCPGCSSRPSAAYQAMDLDGKPAVLDAGPNGAALVIVFLGVECPIANRCLPELVALEKELAPQGVRFHHVYPNPDETAEVVRRHRREYQLSSTAYRDPEWRLARQLHASRTPEAVALTPDGRRIYQGRINDQFAALGVGKPEPTRHDLALALRDFLKGAPPSGISQPAVGCSFRPAP